MGISLNSRCNQGGDIFFVFVSLHFFFHLVVIFFPSNVILLAFTVALSRNRAFWSRSPNIFSTGADKKSKKKRMYLNYRHTFEFFKLLRIICCFYPRQQLCVHNEQRCENEMSVSKCVFEFVYTLWCILCSQAAQNEWIKIKRDQDFAS